MGSSRFGAPVAPNPWINRLEIWLGWLRRQSDHTCQNGTNRPSRVGGAKGWNIMFNWVIFSFFFYFSCQALENTFLGVSQRFLHWMMCFGGDWFLVWSQHSSLIFFPSNSPKKLQILGPFLNFEKLRLKMLNNGDAHLQTTLNHRRSLPKDA